MGDMHRTDTRPADRDPRTDKPGSRPDDTAAGGTFNPSVHDIYWREAFKREPYFSTDYTYDDYAPAYRTGYEAAARHLGQNMPGDFDNDGR